MTPKQKANEIYQKFSNTANSFIEGKKCALICANEIIHELDDLPKIPYNERRLKHWKEIKIHIESI